MLCSLILGKFAWGPDHRRVSIKREQSIAAMIDEAKRGQEQAAEQLKHYEAKLAAAGEEARDLVSLRLEEGRGSLPRIEFMSRGPSRRRIGNENEPLKTFRSAKNVALTRDHGKEC